MTIINKKNVVNILLSKNCIKITISQKYFFLILQKVTYTSSFDVKPNVSFCKIIAFNLPLMSLINNFY